MFVGVGARDVEGEIGMATQCGCQPSLHGFEVVGITRAVGELDVQIARFLLEGEVVGAVNGQGEDRRVVTEDGGGPVPLVHVEIEDGRPAERALALEGPHRHRHVVEDAEALAPVGEGMMGASGQAYRDALGEGRPGRREGASHRPSRPLHELGGPGEADPPDLLSGG